MSQPDHSDAWSSDYPRNCSIHRSKMDRKIEFIDEIVHGRTPRKTQVFYPTKFGTVLLWYRKCWSRSPKMEIARSRKRSEGPQHSPAIDFIVKFVPNLLCGERCVGALRGPVGGPGTSITYRKPFTESPHQLFDPQRIRVVLKI